MNPGLQIALYVELILQVLSPKNVQDIMSDENKSEHPFNQTKSTQAYNLYIYNVIECTIACIISTYRIFKSLSYIINIWCYSYQTYLNLKCLSLASITCQIFYEMGNFYQI